MADGQPAPFEAFLGPLDDAVRARLADLESADAVTRLWRRDATLWKPGDAHHQDVVSHRLGWLPSPGIMQRAAEDLAAFAREARGEGFRHAFLLGMGGSSLCPEVLSSVFGPGDGGLELVVLDTTDPATIQAAESTRDLRRCLFLASSKSGTTVETLSLHRFFRERLKSLGAAATGRQFVAITDPGTPLEALGREESFRRVFLNPSDIGGRYSALSYFGLVPAALLGLNLPKLLDRAARMSAACGPAHLPVRNTGVRLGSILGEAARAGRDKTTFLCSPEIASFGLWVEQLIAESTGKEGRGILPVEGEPLGRPSAYGKDRLFVHLRLKGGSNADIDAAVSSLKDSGQPVVRLDLEDRYDLGGEFLRWEIATAIAGIALEVDPFDEPNVKESKENTERLLKVLVSEGRLPETEPILREELLAFHATPDRGKALMAVVQEHGWPEGAPGLLAAHLASSAPGDYLAIMAYVTRTNATAAGLQSIRTAVRDGRRIATTIGYGPRFLHSTGQYHKGGPDRGLFLQITADVASDLPIPESGYTFGTLRAAQAMGDLEALNRRNRRTLRVHIHGDLAAGIQALDRAATVAAGLVHAAS